MEIIETRVYRNRPTLYVVDLGDGPVKLTRAQLDLATPPELAAYEPADTDGLDWDAPDDEDGDE